MEVDDELGTKTSNKATTRSKETQTMEGLSRDVKLWVVNFLVLIFDKNIDDEHTVLVKSANQRRRLGEEAFHNVCAVVNLSCVNRDWQELLHHHRMSRLWKSCYCMLEGVSSVYYAEKHLHKTATLSSTDVSMDACVALGKSIKAERCNEQFKRAVDGRDLEKCKRLLNFTGVDWKRSLEAEWFVDACYSKDVVWWELISYILQHRCLKSLSVCNFLTISVDNLPHKYLVQYVNILQNATMEELNDEDLWKHSMLVVASGPDNLFHTVSPVLLTLKKKHKLKPECTEQLSTLIRNAWKVSAKQCNIYERVLFWKQIYGPTVKGVEEGINELFVHWFQNSSRENTSTICKETIDFLLREFKVDKHKFVRRKACSPLHSMVTARVNTQTCELIFKEYKDIFSQMLIERDYDDHLPIQLFLHKYTSLRAHKSLSHEVESDRLKMIELFVSHCPKVSIYTHDKVSSLIKEMINVTGDNKHHYTKYIKLLDS